jgi:hypothetical protein
VDSCYSQLYKQFRNAPYKDAGIDGFKSPQPFGVPAHFACQGNFKDFHFPTLLVLNDEFDPFPWMDNDKEITLLNPDVVKADTVMYNGLPPFLELIQPPSIPPISTLLTSIIALSDRLFFISHSLGNPSVCEWHLVCTAVSDSTALSPSCLQDKRFLIKFYTLHHDDVRFNATNQPYWLQYHSLGNLTTPTSNTSMHLIRHSDTLEALAMKQKLVPFCCWLNLTHLDTYLH